MWLQHSSAVIVRFWHSPAAAYLQTVHVTHFLTVGRGRYEATEVQFPIHVSNVAQTKYHHNTNEADPGVLQNNRLKQFSCMLLSCQARFMLYLCQRRYRFMLGRHDVYSVSSHLSLCICMYIFLSCETPSNMFNPIMASYRYKKCLLMQSS